QDAPVPGAKVCLWLDSTVYAIDTTDASGRAELAISPGHAGNMSVTVTGRNLRPYRGTCRVLFAGGPSVLYLKHAISDSPPGGNGDGCVSPGETVTLPLWVQNYGDSTARAVSGRVVSADTFCRILDSLKSFGTIPARDSGSTGPAGFCFSVSANCPDGRLLSFTLRCTDSLGSSWVSGFSIPVGAALLEFCDTIITDSLGNRNGRPDPEETCAVVVGLRNTGFGFARDVVARLRCPDPRLTILDSIGTIGDIPPWNVRSNLADPFRLVTSRLVPETRIVCSLHVAISGATRTFNLPMTFGRLSGTDPLRDGPREPPLYWAYDEADTLWPEHPVYDWVETRGRGTRLDLGLTKNDTIFLPPAFGPFRFYGQRCTTLTVSAHGWVAPGLTGYRNAVNQRLPKGSGPPLLCVNWDGFRPDSGNGVWFWHDTLGRRFVIEWDSVHYVTPSTHWDKFQIVIWDTTLAARDGSTVFDFQYATANGFTGATVGIQDPTGQVGITCLHDTSRSRATMPMRPGRVVRFTTNPPIVGIAEPSSPSLPVSHSSPITISPNPCPGRALLRFASPPAGPLLIRIFDASGSLRLTSLKSPSAGLKSGIHLNLSALPAGIYFVHITTPSHAHRLSLTPLRSPPLKLILTP
ncbi:MAG: T9SS type A sorting domain-containing protein, partial [candidate division WOR-3 bacterium]